MAVSISANLPTIYEHYALPKIESGLSADQNYFTLNGKNITLYSGALHYFRVPRPYWRDRLRKMRAAGLNAVETYIPWNLHEPQSGKFDFGRGASDMEDFLHLEEFLKTAQEEDLLVVLRPGPFICAEWEFGGFPSWLLREPEIKFRTADEIFMKYVTRYFSALLPILALFQFTRGGPVVAFQVENEYGSTESRDFVPDRVYLEKLAELYAKFDIRELLVTSDSPTAHGSAGTIPGKFLQTANFASNPKNEFDALKTLQFNKPTMAMEYWTGWFDHWSEMHHTRNNEDFAKVYEEILSYPASVNMYMFHGGTSFGFLNGANLASGQTDNSDYQPDTTSYDYDAPLNEIGDYTEKYVTVKNLIKKYNPISTKIPLTPAIAERTAYPTIKIQQEMTFDDIVGNVDQHFLYRNPIAMEHLPINNNSGQSYGYILYRRTNLDIPANSILTIEGHVCDSVIVLINGLLISKPLTQLNDLNNFGFWRLKNSKINLGPRALQNATIDLLVENWGRANFGLLTQFYQRKGLWQGRVQLNTTPLENWHVTPLEFKRRWNEHLTKNWRAPSNRWAPGPTLYKASLVIEDPKDTYVSMGDWIKGIVIVNGFVLGRYARIGPQQSLYWPAPLQKRGENTILIFEHYIPGDCVKFATKPEFKTAKKRSRG